MRHQCDELGRDRQVAEVGDRDLAVGDARGQLSDLVVRPLQEFAQETELAKQLQRRGMHRVAAEITEEVGMLFKNDDLAPGTSEQEASHHSGWSAASDNQVDLSHAQTALRSQTSRTAALLV